MTLKCWRMNAKSLERVNSLLVVAEVVEVQLVHLAFLLGSSSPLAILDILCLVLVLAVESELVVV